MSIQNESNIEMAIEKIEELRSAGSLEHSDYGYLHDLLTGIDVQIAPLYSPVKPEDVTNGYYWLVTQDGEKTIERIWDGYNNGGFGMEQPDGWVTVFEIYMWGGILFRIPELPPLEVAE